MKFIDFLTNAHSGNLEVSDWTLPRVAATVRRFESGLIKDLPYSSISSGSIDAPKIMPCTRFDLLWIIWNNYGVPAPLWPGLTDGRRKRDFGGQAARVPAASQPRTSPDKEFERFSKPGQGF